MTARRGSGNVPGDLAEGLSSPFPGGGGETVVAGTPQEVPGSARSHAGRILRGMRSLRSLMTA